MNGTEREAVAVAEAAPAEAGALRSGDRTFHHATPYQLFMLALCLFALALLAFEAAVPVDAGTLRILATFDALVCAVFFVDFVVSLVRAQDRRAYLVKWGWIDLLSSVPALDVLRLGRTARIVRVLRVLRAAKAAKTLGQVLFERRTEAAGLAAALMTLLLVSVASVAVLHFEKDVAGANIRNADDALWWAVTTVTTVGYGDRYPTTGEGRVVGVILMAGGLGLLATMSGLIASWFLGSRSSARELEARRLAEEVRELRRVLEDRTRARP